MVIEAIPIGKIRTHWMVIYSKDKNEPTGYIPLNSELTAKDIAEKIQAMLKEKEIKGE